MVGLGQTGKVSHDKNVKKESSVSPKVPQRTDKELSKSPPPVLSPRTPNLPQQASKPTKTPPKSPKKKKDTDTARKNPNSVTEVKEASTPRQTDESNRQHPTARLEATPKVPHSDSKMKHSQLYKLSKKPSVLSVVGPPLKIPMVEIKALPRETLSPRKASSSSLPDINESAISLGEAEASSMSSIAMTIDDDVVHCVCGDTTDEGFMIQVRLGGGVSLLLYCAWTVV